MKEQFSPLNQRLIAIGLLVLLLVMAVSFIVLPIVNLLWGGIASLNDLRLQVARAEAIRDRPQPPPVEDVPPTLYLTATDRKTANEMLIGQLAAAAARHELQAQIDPAMGGEGVAPALLSIAFRASGEQRAVLAFLNEIERGVPLIRFRSVQLIQAANVPTISTPQQFPPAVVPNAAMMAGSMPEAAAEPALSPGQLGLQANVIALWGAKR